MTTAIRSRIRLARHRLSHRSIGLGVTVMVALMIAFVAPGSGYAQLDTPISVATMVGAQSTPAAASTDIGTIGTPAAATPSPSLARSVDCSTVLAIGAATDACVAFVNAVPSSGPVSFTVDGVSNPGAEGVDSGDFADFSAVPTAADLNIQAVVGDAPDEVLAEEIMTLDAGVAYVVVLEQRYDQDGATLVAIPLDLSPPGDGASRVAFHHAVTDAAGLSVIGLDAPSDESILPGETTDPIDVQAGDYELSISPANDQEQVLAGLPLQLESDLSYLVIIGGTTGDQTVTVIYAAAPVADQP